MDSKQQEFIKNYMVDFKKIKERLLSSNSYARIDKSYLIIYLEHISDQNSWIEFKVERREIFITVVGFGYSMWQVSKNQGIEFKNDVKKFIQSAFASDFKKVAFYDRTGELIKEKLIWKDKPELIKETFFGSPIQLIRKWFKNKFRKNDYRTSEVNYSRFV